MPLYEADTRSKLIDTTLYLMEMATSREPYTLGRLP
jgi:hypothetical protein